MARSRSKPLPEVNIRKWVSALNIKSVATQRDMSPKGAPAVLITASPDSRDRCILSVWGESYADGVNMYFVARPYEYGTPILHMKFKEWSKERGMAGLLAIMAFHAEKPRLPRRNQMADDWLRKMRNRILRSFYREGKDFTERGVHSVLIDAAVQCEKRFLSLAGLDVSESKERVRKEFKLLTDHISEDELLTIWREVLISKVLRS